MSLVPYVRPRTATPRRSSSTRVHQAYAFACQNKGLDISNALPNSDPQTALRLENLVPRSLGLELRPGYSRWVSNIAGEVRTLMPFTDETGLEYLFAGASDGGVYDVTIQQPSSFVPTPVFTAPGDFDGEWSSTIYKTTGGDQVLAMVGAGAGYWTFDGTTWTNHPAGALPGEIDGADPADFDQIMQWKERLFFVERNSTVAWYLPTDQLTGIVTDFDFGAFFPHGGSLAMLANWTVDAGNGIDDKLVVISSQGDILIYSGTNPDDATKFALDGTWYVGKVPVGRRFLTPFAGDIAILCERGLVFLSEILRGQGFYGNAVTANRVNNEIARLVVNSWHQRYWEVFFIPSEQIIVVNTPATPSNKFQWAYEVNAKGFCTLRNLPMLTMRSAGSLPYGGDVEGNVWLLFNGNSDGSVDDVPGTDLEGVVVGAFVPLGEPMVLKRFLMVRPAFIASSAPGFAVFLNPDWQLQVPPGAPPYLAAGGSLWDAALWNIAVWSGSASNYQYWHGIVGTGRYGSLALKIRGSARTLFVSYTVVVEAGGLL